MSTEKIPTELHKAVFGDNDFRAATEVRVEVVMPGNSGCNNAEIFMAKNEAEESPWLTFNPVDADGPLLYARFVQERSDSTGTKLKNWREAGRLQPIHLRLGQAQRGQEQAPVTTEKYFGAGGDHLGLGRRLVEATEDKLREVVSRANFVIGCGAGGGGIGTATLRKMAELAKAANTPATFLLITPDKREGGKLETADALRLELRDVGPTLVVRNGSFPRERRNIPRRQMYQEINESCGNIFKLLRYATQKVGLNNIDLNDMLRAHKGSGDKPNKDLYAGIWQSENHKSNDETGPMPGARIVVNQLMRDPLQPRGMRAKALLFFFGGLWHQDTMDDIIDGVEKFTCAPEDAFVKIQLNDDEQELWCGVLAYGEFEEFKAARKKESVPAEKALETRSEPLRLVAVSPDEGLNSFTSEVPVVTPPPAPPKTRREELLEKYGSEMASNVTVIVRNGTIRTEPIPCTMPAKLYQKLQELKSIQRPSREDVEAFKSVAEEARIFLPEGKEVALTSVMILALQANGSEPAGSTSLWKRAEA